MNYQRRYFEKDGKKYIEVKRIGLPTRVFEVVEEFPQGYMLWLVSKNYPDVGYIALGKLSQAMMYGAEIIAIQGNFDEALECVRAISDSHPITLVNSVNPYRIEGQKTGAFEIVEQKDYIKHAKENGYRSFHMIVRFEGFFIKSNKI